MKRFIQLACASFISTFAVPGFADYSQYPDARVFIDLMVDKHKFNREDMIEWLRNAERKESIIKAMNRPAEKVKPWYEYRQHFVSEQRIRGGVEFWNSNSATLNNVYRDYGVDPAIVVAIIGVETNYGSNTGSFKVVDALTTLAFDYYTTINKQESRQKFFTSELENFFLLAREQNHDPLSLKGSYAGAMGLGQFMPSSYRRYAVDYNKDLFADIWDSTDDAIASVANYFKKNGWRDGEPVATRARISDTPDESELNKLHRPKLTIAELATLGYTPVDELDPKTKALPMSFEGKYGPEYWLGLHNFYVISRYNPRNKYALAVYQLSEAIKARHNELAQLH